VITKSVICSARQHYIHIALYTYAIARRRLSVCLSVDHSKTVNVRPGLAGHSQSAEVDTEVASVRDPTISRDHYIKKMAGYIIQS